MAAYASAADPVAPVTVCEVLSNLSAMEGKEVAVLGRYSFRKDGRWMAEQSCDAAGGSVPILWLSEDTAAGPKPPGNYELDAALLNRKFAEILKRTSLGKFRFGTPDYDRWAVVYGRIVVRKPDAARKPDAVRKPDAARKPDAPQAAADLVFRGSGVVVFLTTDR
jgi:hypothetical protein